jgi:adenylosuccinate synthase
VARFAARINGVTDFVLTKLDVLTGLDTVPVCVAYDVEGTRVEELPVNQSDVHHARPVYENLPGWTGDLSAARDLADLPPNARAYVRFLEEASGAPFSVVGVGPGREECVVVRSLV